MGRRGLVHRRPPFAFLFRIGVFVRRYAGILPNTPMFPNWLVPGAIRAVLLRAPFMRLAMLTIGLLLPMSASAYWLTPSNAVADPQRSYRLEWGGNAGSSGATIQVQAPGSSAWDSVAYCSPGNSSGSCNRPFVVVGTWKARVVDMRSGSSIASTTFYVSPNTITTTFAFGNLSHTYDGNTKTATVTPGSSGILVARNGA